MPLGIKCCTAAPPCPVQRHDFSIPGDFGTPAPVSSTDGWSVADGTLSSDGLGRRLTYQKVSEDTGAWPIIELRIDILSLVGGAAINLGDGTELYVAFEYSEDPEPETNLVIFYPDEAVTSGVRFISHPIGGPGMIRIQLRAECTNQTVARVWIESGGSILYYTSFRILKNIPNVAGGTISYDVVGNSGPGESCTEENDDPACPGDCPPDEITINQTVTPTGSPASDVQFSGAFASDGMGSFTGDLSVAVLCEAGTDVSTYADVTFTPTGPGAYSVSSFDLGSLTGVVDCEAGTITVANVPTPVISGCNVGGTATLVFHFVTGGDSDPTEADNLEMYACHGKTPGDCRRGITCSEACPDGVEPCVTLLVPTAPLDPADGPSVCPIQATFLDCGGGAMCCAWNGSGGTAAVGDGTFYCLECTTGGIQTGYLVNLAGGITEFIFGEAADAFTRDDYVEGTTYCDPVGTYTSAATGRTIEVVAGCSGCPAGEPVPPEVGGAMASAPPLAEPLRTTPVGKDCPHWQGQVSSIGCAGCGGRQSLVAINGCALYDECADRSNVGVRYCGTCPDHPARNSNGSSSSADDPSKGTP